MNNTDWNKGSIIFTALITIVSTVIGIAATWIIGHQQFKDYQTKVASATSENIILEQKACDRILRIIKEKVDKAKVKNTHKTETVLVYLDNIRNQAVALKEIINNPKAHWDIIFPEYTKEHAKEIQTVKLYDRQLLNIIANIKELNKKIDLAQKSGETEALKKSIESLERTLQDTVEQFEAKLQSYGTLPTIYPSSVVSPNSLITGELILSDGSLFKSSTWLNTNSLSNQSYGILQKGSILLPNGTFESNIMPDNAIVFQPTKPLVAGKCVECGRETYSTCLSCGKPICINCGILKADGLSLGRTCKECSQKGK